MTPQMDELRAKALAGDKLAAAQFRAAKWNDTVPVGTSCVYLKSEIEGKVIAKSSRAAWHSGEYVFVELDHIGMVLLDKVEVFFKDGSMSVKTPFIPSPLQKGLAGITVLAGIAYLLGYLPSPLPGVLLLTGDGEFTAMVFDVLNWLYGLASYLLMGAGLIALAEKLQTAEAAK